MTFSLLNLKQNTQEHTPQNSSFSQIFQLVKFQKEAERETHGSIEHLT